MYCTNFMTNCRYREMQQLHQDCHTEVTGQLSPKNFVRLNLWNILIRWSFWNIPRLKYSQVESLKYSDQVEPTFWEFVQYVLAHPSGDPHWKPFTQVRWYLQIFLSIPEMIFANIFSSFLRRYLQIFLFIPEIIFANISLHSCTILLGVHCLQCLIRLHPPLWGSWCWGGANAWPAETPPGKVGNKIVWKYLLRLFWYIMKWHLHHTIKMEIKKSGTVEEEQMLEQLKLR